MLGSVSNGPDRWMNSEGRALELAVSQGQAKGKGKRCEGKPLIEPSVPQASHIAGTSPRCSCGEDAASVPVNATCFAFRVLFTSFTARLLHATRFRSDEMRVEQEHEARMNSRGRRFANRHIPAISSAGKHQPRPLPCFL